MKPSSDLNFHNKKSTLPVLYQGKGAFYDHLPVKKIARVLGPECDPTAAPMI